MAWTFSKNVNIKQRNFSKASQGRRPGAMPPSPPPTHPPPPPPAPFSPTIFHTHTHTHTILCSENKKGKQRKKRKSFKAETIKRLSPRSKCYCFSHSRASRIQKFFLPANHGGRQYFSAFHGPSTLKSISPALKKILLVHSTTFFRFYFTFLLIFVLNLSENSILKY